MKRIASPTAPARRSPFAPLAVLAGGIGIALVLVVSLITLGLALLFLRGRGTRVFRFGTSKPMPHGAEDPLEDFPRAASGPAARGGAVNGRASEGAAETESNDTPRASRGRREPSYAEVLEALPLVALTGLLLAAASPAQARTLVPMDDRQTDHLKAYGLAYWALSNGHKGEWLLNYRGGSFLMPDDDTIVREASIRGVTLEPVGGAAEAAIRAEIADNNMEAVALEKPPKVAVYIPPNAPPWDDAVTLALEYAAIPYARVWDEEVLRGDLAKYDWLHLHHEDFTGQHGKFYAAYHNFPWYQEEERVQKAMATKLGFAKITQLKAAVALGIKDYVGKGGFMFGMCSATDTYDIALAALGLDIADVVYDGDPADFSAARKLDFAHTLAFKDFRLELDPYVYKFSDIDVTQEAAQRGPESVFTLFDFSAKNDPVPSMLVQNHVNAVPEFLGQSTGFRRGRVKSGVLVLGEVESTDEVKYLHGQYGRGTFTFLGGHDPEDYQHMVGDPPTELSRYKHSPGYRLILNNVLFPAAEKKKQRT